LLIILLVLEEQSKYNYFFKFCLIQKIEGPYTKINKVTENVLNELKFGNHNEKNCSKNFGF